jgi:hypothetical protein
VRRAAVGGVHPARRLVPDAGELDGLEQDRLAVLRLVLGQHRMHEATAESESLGGKPSAAIDFERLAAHVVQIGERTARSEQRQRATRGARVRHRVIEMISLARRSRHAGAPECAPGAPTAPRSCRCARGPRRSDS